MVSPQQPTKPREAIAKIAHLEGHQPTVMFCDLVGSTALSLRFDAEDLRDIIVGYLACCESIVKRFEGHIARGTGDGLLVFFGFPTATERDAERAIQAGLAIISAVNKLRLRPNLVLQTRIGIATGASDAEGEVLEPTIVRGTPDLAARLQALAEPDSVVIADTTRRVAGDLFEYVDLGCNRLAGFSEPTQAWRVVKEHPTASPVEAIQNRKAALTPLVNRRDELAMLHDRWQRAKAGQGQVVLLSGEPGIGKSRLSLALREQLVGEACTVLRYFGSPYHENTSLYPIVSQLEHAAQLAGTDSPSVKLDKLEVLLRHSSDDVQRAAPLFASLLSIPTQGRYPPLELSVRRLKQSTFEAIEAQLDGLAAKHPVLIVFEDLQWADPTTKELLGRLVARTHRLPLLLLVTCRPEFTPSWEDQPHVTKCILNRLTEPESKTVIEGLSRGKPLPSEVLQEIIARCDGLPLCLEELTKTVLETGHLRDDGDRYTPIIPLPEVVIPETLHDSLMARLDGLGKWREVARTAAVIGRQFSFNLLSAVLSQAELELNEALMEMVGAELIVVSSGPPNATYTFKHALVRDAAYSSLTRAKRKALHARSARILEEMFPETAAREPELLARHFTGATMVEAAIRYWRVAGEQALRRFANAEAINHFTKALELLMTLPESIERHQDELDLQIYLGATFTAVKGFAAPEVETAYKQARILSLHLTDSERVFSVWRGLWVFDLVRAQWQQAYELAGNMVAMSQRENSSGYKVEAHRAMGVTLFWLGEFVRARENLEHVRLQYVPEHHHSHALRHGNDPGVASLVHEAYVLWVLGYPDRALACSDDALALARRLNHPFSLAQALLYRSFLHQHRREAEAAERFAKETERLAAEHGFPFWLAESIIVQGWALAQNGEAVRGLERVRNGLNSFLATGAEMDRPRWLGTLAETYARNGQADAGLSTIREAAAAMADTGERFYESRLYALEGSLLLQQRGLDAAAEAEASFLKSLKVARRQGAKSWELGAASNLARLWCKQGKQRDARNLLEPVHAWFREGFDSGDLRDAGAVLQELAS